MKNVMSAKQMSQKFDDPMVIVVQTSSFINTIFMFAIGFFSLTMTYLTYRQSKNNPASTAILPAKLNRKAHNKMHDILDNYFNEQELRDICFELGIDYEDLPFSGQTNKARELVALSVHTGQFAQLNTLVKEERPYLFDEAILTQKPKQKKDNLGNLKNNYPLPATQIHA